MTRREDLRSTIERGVAGLWAVLLVCAAGCAPQPVPYPAALEVEGRIDLYLQPLPQEAHRLEFSITAIAAVRNDAVAVPLAPLLTELSGRDLVGVQKRLASSTLAPGSYAGLSIGIGKASLVSETGAADLLVPDEALWVEQPFTIVPKRSSALFLSLDPEKLVTRGYRFTPVFSLAKPRRQLRGLQGFVTSSAHNVVAVFNKHTMEVVDTIATGSGPRGAVLDPRRGWVYVALAGDDAIEAIEVNTREVLRRLELDFADEPLEIALSRDRALLVTANHGSNSASIVDATSLREVGRVSLPSSPTWVVTSTASSRAYLLQPLSNAVSIIDLSRRELVTTRTLEETPTRAALSSDGDSLYVITRYSPDLLVMDAANLTLRGRIFVGAGASSVQVDPKTGLVYVGTSDRGISVVDPSSLLPIDRFRVKGDAAYLAIDDEENGLLVVLPDRGSVAKIDLVGKQVKGVIEVEDGSYAVVLMGSR